MASVINMPRMSDTMEEGTLLRWLKEEGEEVSPGEALAEVETDKATLELESFEDGILAKKLVTPGTAVAIGAPVAVMAEDEDDDISEVMASLAGGAPAPTPSSTPAPALTLAPESAPAAAVAPKEAVAPPAVGKLVTSGEATGRVKVSPLARKMANQLDISLHEVHGSGPGGRIIARDIEAAAETQKVVHLASPVAVDREVPLTGMRKTIARRMVAAKQEVPHFYLTMDIDMAPAAAFRSALNEAADGAFKVSFNDLILKASALALLDHPWVNSSFAGDRVIFHEGAHIGVAIALDGGLVSPVVRNAENKSLGQIAQEVRELAGKAQNKRLKPEEYQGGTFTVSNLGMFGIQEFVAIIDPPQGAILAVGSVEDRPVVVDGALAVGKRMTVTLSCDHRVIDGATGAKFLGTLRDNLQKPMRLAL